jgi:hypothetical protein
MQFPVAIHFVAMTQTPRGTPFSFLPCPVYWVGFTVVDVKHAFASAVEVGPEIALPVFAPGRTAAAPLVVPVPQLAGATG